MLQLANSNATVYEASLYCFPSTLCRYDGANLSVPAGVQVDADGTSIRRRPPRGVDSQPCGPMVFTVDTDAETGGDNAPRNILEEIVWFKAQEIEKWRLVTPAAQIAAQALQVLSSRAAVAVGAAVPN